MSSAVYEAFAAALGGKNERVVQIAHPHVVFLAQNYGGRPALVAKVALEPNQILRDGRGFAVAVNRSGPDSFVRITSAETGINLVFLKLVDLILERTAEADDAAEAVALLVGAIDEFRRFAGRRPGRLSEEEIRGLVAELLMLRHIHGRVGERTWDVFHSWGGPFGAAHDFEFAEGNAIEVKSTHRPPTEIRISSPSQTEPLPDGLELIVLPLEKVEPGADAEIVFVDLVADVGAVARAHGGDVAELWAAALEALGLDLTDEYYDEWRFARGPWLRYMVREDFPRIKESDVPHGVVKVGYSLRLSALASFEAPFADLEVLA